MEIPLLSMKRASRSSNKSASFIVIFGYRTHITESYLEMRSTVHWTISASNSAHAKRYNSCGAHFNRFYQPLFQGTCADKGCFLLSSVRFSAVQSVVCTVFHNRERSGTREFIVQSLKNTHKVPRSSVVCLHR